jgi:hypothetical protein
LEYKIMNKSFPTFIKSTLAVATLTVASTGVYAAGAVSLANTWDAGNHLMHAGQSISALNQEADKQSFTSNPTLDSASWGHFGSWYTFMTHEVADTTISVTATDTANMSPGFAVWRTDGEFDGGTGQTGELSTKAKGTPHAFNSVGAAGDYGTWWMTDDSVAISDSNTNGGVGFTANGILENMGYASDGPHQAANGWGEMVHFDGTTDGHTELTLDNLAAGWYLVFVGGSDGTLTGSNVDINVSSVPVPAAVYLFGSAIVGLFVSRRKLAVA